MATRRRSHSTNKRAATIRQVAELAGVSTATVSRVVAGTNQVSDELIERVQQAAKTLNYQPSRTARNLRMQKTYTAALVISDIENPFFTSVVRGVERTLRDAGYSLLLANSDEDSQIEMEHLVNLRAEDVAGIIVAPTHDDPRRYEQLLQAGLRMVAIDRAPAGLRMDRVTVNNNDGAQAAVKHLIEQGHTRIGFIGGIPRISTAADRQAGFETAMKAHLIDVHPQWIQTGDFRQASGAVAMDNILNLADRPTAVIIANNLMTLGALQTIYRFGLRIPDEIAVVGFDDMTWAGSLNPPLTVVAQPTRELGMTAAQLLLDCIENPDRPCRHVMLDTQLIVRKSSGPHAPAKPDRS